MPQNGSRQLPWRETGVWLKGDTHTHHRLIGGAEMLAGAAPYCDFIALTSHAHEPDAVAAGDGRSARTDLVVSGKQGSLWFHWILFS